MDTNGQVIFFSVFSADALRRRAGDLRDFSDHRESVGQ